MKVEVSIGEAIDKFSILELKKDKIQNETKLQEIQKELDVLNECNEYKNEHPFFYRLLMYVNGEIWTMTDTIKTLNWEDEPHIFSKISNQIFEFNQKRFRIKNWFNLMVNSNIKEQKSYDISQFGIIIEDEQVFYNKISEVLYLTLEYDSITIYTTELMIPLIQNIIKIPNIIYENINVLDFSILERETNRMVYLKDYFVQDIPIGIFELPLIHYLAGGMFGDFIQSLSVINAKFYETGRKGILYISDGCVDCNSFTGDIFRNGVENTYNDSYEIIMKQNYIKDYQLYNNQSIEINLNQWRSNPNLYQKNWYHIYKETYNVEWGKHKWLNNIDVDDKWKDIILINTTSYRWTSLNFKQLETEEYQKTYNKIVFITNDENQYRFFLENSSIQAELYLFTSFNDLCIAINSCKLFIGCLSAPLSIAHSLYKERICGLNNCYADSMHNSTLNEVWGNIKFDI